MTADRVADVVVVGSGVIGLTTAVVLAEAGRRVTVVADQGWAGTTSRVAGAVWEPYLSDGPDVLRWAVATYAVLGRMAADGVPGVRVGELVEGGPGDHDPPGWAAAVGGVRRLGAGELRPGWDSGFGLEVPLVDMGRYLPYLAGRLGAAGGTVLTRHLGRLDEVGPATTVVNCSGLGARALVGDSTMRPVRGQVVVVANPGIRGAVVSEAVAGKAVAGDPSGRVAGEAVAGDPSGRAAGEASGRADSEPQGRADSEAVAGEASGRADSVVTYVIAHEHEVVLGGTSDVGEESVEVDPIAAAAIVARAGRLDVRLRGAAVVAHRVGLRPWRPTVRLEVDADAPPSVGRLIHNYGHGGSGLTLSWGCAADVAAQA